MGITQCKVYLHGSYEDSRQSFHVQVNNRKRAAPKGTVRQREESTDSVEPPPTFAQHPLPSCRMKCEKDHSWPV